MVRRLLRPGLAHPGHAPRSGRAAFRNYARDEGRLLSLPRVVLPPLSQRRAHRDRAGHVHRPHRLPRGAGCSSFAPSFAVKRAIIRAMLRFAPYLLLLTMSATAAVKIEKTNYKGWPKRVRLPNGEVEPTRPKEFRPRIMGLPFGGAQLGCCGSPRLLR